MAVIGRRGTPTACPPLFPQMSTAVTPARRATSRAGATPSQADTAPAWPAWNCPAPCALSPPVATPHTHPLHPYACLPQAPICCTQCPPPGHLRMGPLHQLSPHPAYHMPFQPSGPDHCGHVPTRSTQSEYAVPQPRYTSPRGTQLSMEQRKVFVTYESDSEDHVKEIIKFVALLRHNGFDTHIDVFEQQLNSISKIDCTERYIQEKDYLIIIAISPKYHEVVAGDRMFVERDERTLNTVYIHKQLQNEFIQNGCKNFRFIPILFPGAKKSHVPTWLQNTHVYSWPKDRDDILRRLMRVEKYNPPPIGELPTIVSIPI
ncbi:E3 ubiquitin ligase TRAF3IP2-like isoform X2 [Clupea harengus]|uniref:E3 ubiquitin ligase TRAF3IP2 n=1 Tax=Clupea harengus TaxID=7950 RepID=A0A6P8EQY9_CLUHA|nr:E3 ubiquitin ligase TRAF3IP2-like isoform X2 [Clupea harengus]XP_042558848.1 E3 ubiquitin ligase TRAF3IP2-like isoform X2 [Clupea harengus]XP_042558849.1 E3 ubiquitin ligase TRAF3IP2-like isoform X2 [Clupea harengus]